MFTRLKEWYRWLNGKPRYYAELEEQNFVHDVSIEQGHQSQNITLAFAEPIKDGNDAHGITILHDGEAIHRNELYAGETSYTLRIEEYRLNTLEYGIAIVDTSGQVICSNSIELSKV